MSRSSKTRASWTSAKLGDQRYSTPNPDLIKAFRNHSLRLRISDEKNVVLIIVVHSFLLWVATFKALRVRNIPLLVDSSRMEIIVHVSHIRKGTASTILFLLGSKTQTSLRSSSSATIQLGIPGCEMLSESYLIWPCHAQV